MVVHDSAETRGLKQQRAHATHRAVLEGAGVVFSREGYAAASVSDICEAANVTQGGLYFHFSSKEQLALAVVGEQHKRTFGLLGRLEFEPARTLDYLIQVSALVIRQLVVDPVVRAGIRLGIEADMPFPSIPGFYRTWIDALGEQLREGITAGAISRKHDPVRCAQTLISCFTGSHLISNLLTGYRDVNAVVSEMWQLFIPSLAPTERQNELIEYVHDIFRDA